MAIGQGWRFITKFPLIALPPSLLLYTQWTSPVLMTSGPDSTTQREHVQTHGSPGGGENVPGEKKTTGTAVLESGASVLQSFKPINQINQHVCTWAMFHDQPSRTIETHHHVATVNDDFFQCVVYDSDKKNARIVGVEYVITPKLFETLSDEEKKLWHSHFYEIRTGLWVLPGVPTVAERGILPKMAKTYGKFWNTWQTDKFSLPLGLPALMTSPQEQAQVPAELVAARDKRYGMSTEEVEKNRQDFTPPEGGIHPLSDHWKTGKGYALELKETELIKNK
jgi:hypothetical protein